MFKTEKKIGKEFKPIQQDTDVYGYSLFVLVLLCDGVFTITLAKTNLLAEI